MSKRKFSEEQEAEIVRRYQEGDTAQTLGVMFSVGEKQIRGVLKTRGVSLRNKSAAMLVSVGKSPIEAHAISEISKDRLMELYWGEQQLSTASIGKMVGVNLQVIKRMLKGYKIPIRTMGEQLSIDYRTGRRVSSFSGKPRSDRQQAASRENGIISVQKKAGVKLTKDHIENIRLSLQRRTVVHCEWCGASKSMMPCRAKRQYQACNQKCSGQWLSFRSKHGPDAPRPLIVEKLRALWQKDPRKSRHGPTVDLLEKLAAEIGAREPEIDAVMLEYLDRQEAV